MSLLEVFDLRLFFTHDIPTIWRWVKQGSTQPAVALPGPVEHEQPIDEAIYDDEPESFDEVDSAEVYIDDDDFKDEAPMGDWLNRNQIEKRYINELFQLHGIAASIKRGVMGAHTFYGYRIGLGINAKGSLEKWANVERVAPEIEAILHNNRIESGAIDEGVDRGLIEPDYRTRVRVTDQPMALEVSRIDVRTLEFDIEQYEGEPHTAFAGIGYANGRAINVVWDLEDPDTPHLMIAGRTGSGKSVLLTCIVGTLAHATPVEELDLYLIDGKNEDLVPFAALPHARSFTHLADDNMRVIEHVASIVEERNENDDRKRIVLVIDELAEVIKSNNQADIDHLIACLSTIAQKGRSKNVTLIGCTQRPTAAVVGSDVKASMPLKYIGSVGSPEDAKLVSGIKGTGAEKLPGRGSFLAVKSTGISRFQSPFIDDAGHIVSVVCDRWGYEIDDSDLGEVEETDAMADITMQKYDRSAEEYFDGIDEEGYPMMRRGWIKAAIMAINDGVYPPKGHERVRLSRIVKEKLDIWLVQRGCQGVTKELARGCEGVEEGAGTYNGNPSATGAQPHSNPAETPGATPQKRHWVSDAPLAVKPLFVNRNIKH